MKFTPWVRFDDRKNLPNTQYPGIYAFAISENSLAGREFGLSEKIVLLGVTFKKAGIKGRLEQFNNSIRGKSGIGDKAARRMRREYKDGEELAKRLYVSICHIKCDVTALSREDIGTIYEGARAAYLALEEFHKRYNRHPKYNFPGASSKPDKPSVRFSRSNLERQWEVDEDKMGRSLPSGVLREQRKGLRTWVKTTTVQKGRIRFLGTPRDD